MAAFADATKVAQLADDTEFPARFSAQIDPQWTVLGRPHGGYLVAILARAAATALAATGHVDPLAVGTHFLASPAIGPATVEVVTLRAGRGVSQVRATLVQNGAVCVAALLTMGRLDPASAAYWSGEPAIDLPDPAMCVRAAPPAAPDDPGVFKQVEVLLDPAVTSFARGTPDGSGELRGWFMFSDGTPPDPVSLLLVADILPPASLTINLSGWVPTLELNVYVRAAPAPGPLRVRQRAVLIERTEGARNALMDEVCEVWDTRGRLVCRATQLASVRFR